MPKAIHHTVRFRAVPEEFFHTYFDKLKPLLDRFRPRLGRTHRLDFKPFFGAVAGYLDGRIFVSCGKFGIALRLPPETLRSVLKMRGSKPLKYFPKGHVKKEYAIIPPAILESESRFKELLDKSVRYARLAHRAPR